MGKLNAAYAGALKHPQIVSKRTALDPQVVASSPAALGTSLAQSIERYRAIGKALNIQPE